MAAAMLRRSSNNMGGSSVGFKTPSSPPDDPPFRGTRVNILENSIDLHLSRSFHQF